MNSVAESGGVASTMRARSSASRPARYDGCDQRLDRRRQRVARWRVILGESKLAQARRKVRLVDRTGRAEDVDTWSDAESTSGRAFVRTVAGGERLHRERWAEIRQDHGHGPRPADRACHDLVGIRKLEWIADRLRVGIHLETPQTRAHLVEEVDPVALVRHGGRRAIARDAAQRGRIRRRRVR